MVDAHRAIGHVLVQLKQKMAEAAKFWSNEHNCSAFVRLVGPPGLEPGTKGL